MGRLQGTLGLFVVWSLYVLIYGRSEYWKNLAATLAAVALAASIVLLSVKGIGMLAQRSKPGWTWRAYLLTKPLVMIPVGLFLCWFFYVSIMGIYKAATMSEEEARREVSSSQYENAKAPPRRQYKYYIRPLVLDYLVGQVKSSRTSRCTDLVGRDLRMRGFTGKELYFIRRMESIRADLLDQIEFQRDKSYATEYEAEQALSHLQRAVDDYARQAYEDHRPNTGPGSDEWVFYNWCGTVESLPYNR